MFEFRDYCGIRIEVDDSRVGCVRPVRAAACFRRSRRVPRGAARCHGNSVLRDTRPIREDQAPYCACEGELDDFSDQYEMPFRIGEHDAIPIRSTEAIKRSIYENGPGVMVFETGTAHAVTVVGYDDSRSSFLYKDSRGETAGPNGDGTFWVYYNDSKIRGFYNFRIQASPRISAGYHFDDNPSNDTLVDIKGHNHGTLKGAVSSIPGAVGDALSFDQGEYVAVPDEASLNFGRNDLSICFWVKTTRAYATIFDQRDDEKGYHVVLYGGRPLMNFNEREIGTAWVMFSGPITPSGSTNSAFIGAYHENFTGRYFRGAIGRVSVYAEVSDGRKSGRRPAYPPGLSRRPARGRHLVPPGWERSRGSQRNAPGRGRP